MGDTPRLSGVWKDRRIWTDGMTAALSRPMRRAGPGEAGMETAHSHGRRDVGIPEEQEPERAPPDVLGKEEGTCTLSPGGLPRGGEV